jgi:hypothetical protein
MGVMLYTVYRIAALPDDISRHVDCLPRPTHVRLPRPSLFSSILANTLHTCRRADFLPVPP